MPTPSVRSWLAGLLDADAAAVKPDTRARLEVQGLDVRALPSGSPVSAESALAGSVYIDANNNGTREESEVGIAGQKVLLTGTTAKGAKVSKESITDAHGNFYFGGLAAGHYTMTQVQPANFQDGKDRGPNGIPATSNDTFAGIKVDGKQGLSSPYLFGELPKKVTPPTPPVHPPVCPPTDDKGSKGKGSDDKGSKGKGSSGKGSSGKGSHGKGKGSSGKGSSGKGSSGKGSHGKGSSGKWDSFFGDKKAYLALVGVGGK